MKQFPKKQAISEIWGPAHHWISEHAIAEVFWGTEDPSAAKEQRGLVREKGKTKNATMT